MHLFIANGTQQIQDFHYRVPDSNKVRQQKIAIGGQIRISGDLTTADIDAIVDQHKIYGMIPAEEIFSGRDPAPTAYRVGKAITQEEIFQLTQRNEGVLVERGKETRKNAAIGLASMLGTAAREGGTGVEFQEAEIEITEEPGKGRSISDGIDEKTVITREDSAQRGRGRGRASRR